MKKYIFIVLVLLSFSNRLWAKETFYVVQEDLETSTLENEARTKRIKFKKEKISKNGRTLKIFFPVKVDQDKKKSIIEDLELLIGLPKSNFGSKLHKEIFGGPFSGKTYQKWFDQRIDYIMIGGDVCRHYADTGEGVGGYFQTLSRRFMGVTLKKHPLVHLCDNYFKRDIVSRLQTLVHESRHSDYPIHSYCELDSMGIFADPAQKGQEGLGIGPFCDDKHNHAYGTGYVFEQNFLEAYSRNIFSTKKFSSEIERIGLDGMTLYRILDDNERYILLIDSNSIREN